MNNPVLRAWLLIFAILVAIVTGLALIVMLATAAEAYTPSRCVVGRHIVACSTLIFNPSARVINLEGRDGIRHEDVTDDDRAAWRARCLPTLIMDAGTPRWTYAESGCGFGP